MLESQRISEECSPLTKVNPKFNHLDNSIVQLGQEACSLINRIDKISLLISSQQLLRKLHGELECLVLRLHSRPLRPKLSSSSMISYKEVRSHSRSRSKDKKKGRNYSLRCFSPEPEIQRYSRSCIGSPLRESKSFNRNIDIEMKKQLQIKEVVDPLKNDQKQESKEDSLVCVPYQMQYMTRQGVFDNESRVKSKECLMKLKELDERSEEDEEDDDEDDNVDENDRNRHWNSGTHRQRNIDNHKNRNIRRNNRWEKSSNSSNSSGSFLDCENNNDNNDNCVLDGNNYHHSNCNNKEDIEQLNEILKNLSISIQNEVANSSDPASIREVEQSMDIIINKLKNI